MAASGRPALGGSFRRVLIGLAVVAVVFGYGMVGYGSLGRSPVDALYMTTLAVTTIGFNVPGTLNEAEKLFTASLAILGVGAYTTVLSLIGTTIAERRLDETARRRRMERRIASLEGHVIVCAYGRVGRTIVRELEAEGVPVVVVDQKEELEEALRSDGVLHVIGDPTSETVLNRAGLARAKALVCAVDSDEAAVYITLTARSLTPEVFIVARAAQPQTADRLYRAGADRVVSPYVETGRQMARVALRPRVVDSLELGDESTGGRRLDELKVEPGSRLIGRTLADVCGSAVPLLRVRGTTGVATAPPDETLRLEAGDLILLFGVPADLHSAES